MSLVFPGRTLYRRPLRVRPGRPIQPPLQSVRLLFSWARSPGGSETTPDDGHSKQGDLLIYQETKQLPYSQQQLYEVIADVEAYPQFVPYCVGSNLLSHLPLDPSERSGPKSNARRPWIQGGNSGESHVLVSELMVGFKTFEERYTSRVECRKWDMVKASASHSSLFKRLDSTWTFRPAKVLSSNSSGSITPNSDVSVHLACAFASPLHAAIGEMFWKKVSERMVSAFETRLAEVYGKPSSNVRPQT